MAGNETREPTLGEVMEEIKKLRNESAKDMERSSMTIWLTPLAVGIAIGLFGLGRLIEVEFGDWRLWWTDAATLGIGLWMIFWARNKVRVREKRFREKWGEEPRF